MQTRTMLPESRENADKNNSTESREKADKNNDTENEKSENKNNCLYDENICVKSSVFAHLYNYNQYPFLILPKIYDTDLKFLDVKTAI